MLICFAVAIAIAVLPLFRLGSYIYPAAREKSFAAAH
jgi:hypothetical protein